MGGVVRRGAVFAVVAVLAGLLQPVSLPTFSLEGRAKADVCPTLLGCDADRTEMERLEQRIVDNMWGGQVYEVDYKDATRTLGQVAGVGAFADSALWTGTYMGAESFRYATAKKYLANPGSLTPADLTFWTTQKNEAKARIDQMIAKFHILINISGSWNHKFNLRLQPFGFGGGIIKGEPGYLMRACIDEAVIDGNAANPPDYQGWSHAELANPDPGFPPPYTSNRRVFGPLPWKNADNTTTNYFCEDGTSRDAYAGTMFGLLVAFDLVSTDDPTMRTAIRDDIVTLSNFAFKYLWNTPRPHGNVSIPIGTSQTEPPCSQINPFLHICGHDFENFFSPLFLLTPTAQMEMAQAARHVTLLAPGHRDTLKWNLIFGTELVAMTPFLAFSEILDTEAPYDSYYKWNLEHLIAYNLVRQAPNWYAKSVYRQATSIVEATTGDDINAHFEAITFALTGEPKKRDDAITHLRQWRDWRARIEAGGDDGLGNTNNLQFCANHTLDCVPESQVDASLTRGADPIVISGSGDLRAHYPLPVARRTPTDFLWQRPPNQLNGHQGLTHQAPGIDYLLPYWMLRYLTEVQAPPYAPYNVWQGPVFN